MRCWDPSGAAELARPLVGLESPRHVARHGRGMNFDEVDEFRTITVAPRRSTPPLRRIGTANIEYGTSMIAARKVNDAGPKAREADGENSCPKAERAACWRDQTDPGDDIVGVCRKARCTCQCRSASAGCDHRRRIGGVDHHAALTRDKGSPRRVTASPQTPRRL